MAEPCLYCFTNCNYYNHVSHLHHKHVTEGEPVSVVIVLHRLRVGLVEDLEGIRLGALDYKTLCFKLLGQAKQFIFVL